MNLVCGYCVQAAAKGIQLDQIQAVTVFHIGSSGIKPGVIHPLVSDNQRPFHLT